MDTRLRIIDACANRAREALRTMEDVARFRLGDRGLCEGLKRLRHDLAAVLGAIPGGESILTANRDTPGDVGVSAKTDTEGRRAGLRGVAIAAGKRAGEALRTLEETAKALDGAPDLWRGLEPLRYRLYELEKRLVLAMGTGRARQWRLCVLITESLCRRPWLEVARESLMAGADALQLREPTDADGLVLHKAVALRVLIDELGAPDRPALIVNNRPDVALLARADGVHLGTGDLPIDAVRRFAGDRLLIGASTHNLDEAESAMSAGADYCGVGAMFAGTTKDRAPSGLGYLREFRDRFPDVPHLTIGGITPVNAPALANAGAAGLAVSSVVCADQDPGRVCRELLAALGGGPPTLPAPAPASSRSHSAPSPEGHSSRSV